jgi:hypothetical protein
VSQAHNRDHPVVSIHLELTTEVPVPVVGQLTQFSPSTTAAPKSAEGRVGVRTSGLDLQDVIGEVGHRDGNDIRVSSGDAEEVRFGIPVVGRRGPTAGLYNEATERTTPERARGRAYCWAHGPRG